MNRVELTRFPELDYACREAINTLCTNLGFVGKEKRIIMVTSPGANDGKSFLAINMTRTLTGLGKKVVLVDCDLRKTNLAARYGLRVVKGNGHGIVHYLAGLCDMKDTMYETNMPGAFIIPVGRQVSNSLALLNTPELGEMLEYLSQQYDFVIVDAPPVGVIIDAAEIAKHCDGTVIVVRYNVTTRRDLLEARKQIMRTGCEILGVVLNRVDLGAISSKKYYNKSYYRYYNSGYYKPEQSAHSEEGL